MAHSALLFGRRTLALGSGLLVGAGLLGFLMACAVPEAVPRAVPEAAPQEPAARDLGVIWCIGDSITQSHRDLDPLGSPRKSLSDLLIAHRVSFSYTGHWTQNPDGLPNTGTTDETNLYQFHSGIGGAVIGDNEWGRVGITQNLPVFWSSGRLKFHKPNLVLIMLGTNDVGLNLRLDKAPARYEHLLDTLRALPEVGDPTILVATIPPFRSRPEVPARVSQFNKALADLCLQQQRKGYKVYLVDQFTALDERFEECMTYDKVHPNARGNAIIASNWFRKIEELGSSLMTSR